MLKTKFATWLLIAPVFVLFSCAPKAVVIEEAPAQKKKKPAESAVLPPLNPLVSDDLRGPDMLSMPSDAEFRATRPGTPRGLPDSGAVIARPPTDPPSRPKTPKPDSE